MINTERQRHYDNMLSDSDSYKNNINNYGLESILTRLPYTYCKYYVDNKGDLEELLKDTNFYVRMDSHYYIVDKFLISKFTHDTGHSNSIYVIGAGEPYKIRTYSNVKSHNYSISGAWDYYLDIVTEKLRKVLLEQHERALEKARVGAEKEKSENLRRKEEVEKLFS